MKTRHKTDCFVYFFILDKQESISFKAESILRELLYLVYFVIKHFDARKGNICNNIKQQLCLMTQKILSTNTSVLSFEAMMYNIVKGENVNVKYKYRK